MSGKGSAVKQHRFSKTVKTRSEILASQLLAVCLERTVSSTSAIAVFNELHSLTTSLIEAQKKFAFLRNLENLQIDRVQSVNKLLKSHTPQSDHEIAAESFGNLGLGLVSWLPIEEGECILRINRKYLMDASTGCSKEFISFVDKDPVACSMENVRLTLRLLHELCHLQDSDYYSYLCTLPLSYSTLLYMSPDDLKYLRGSRTLETLVSNYLSICRQYAYFFNQIRNSGLPGISAFCFEDYRWAVSTVMSRNNLIPQENQSQHSNALCLVPLWDMVNHRPGKVSTDFDLVSGELVFYAMEFIGPGEQIFMDYGKRSNAEFLLFSGFVPQQNPHNHVVITLSVSKADLLAEKRIKLLQKIGLQSPLTRNLSMTFAGLEDLIAFSRVFVMNEEQLDSFLSDSESCVQEIREAPADYQSPVNLNAIQFLIKRFELLIAFYGPLLSTKEYAFTQLTPVQRYCEFLRTKEVSILRLAIKHLETDATSMLAESFSTKVQILPLKSG